MYNVPNLVLIISNGKFYITRKLLARSISLKFDEYIYVYEGQYVEYNIGDICSSIYQFSSIPTTSVYNFTPTTYFGAKTIKKNNVSS